MLFRTFAWTLGATLLAAAGAAHAQTSNAFGGRGGGLLGAPGFANRSNDGARDWRGSSQHHRRHQRFDSGFAYGRGLPFYPYDIGPQDADRQPPVIVSQPPASAPAEVDVRMHPTYSELPYYARTAAPTLQRVIKTRHGVRVVTTTFEQPLTQEVPLTAQP